MSMLLAVGLLTCLCGCNDALFPKDQPRSPYERYSDLRGQTRPAMETKSSGREGPALRQRLAPLE